MGNYSLWESREITLVIILALVSFVYTVLIGQLGNLFTGILGMNYFFIIGHAIFISFGVLIYEGRRWRFFLQGVLVALLTIPTFQSGAPFDILARIPMVVNSFFIDLVFNSLYFFFKKRKKLDLWAILTTTGFMVTIPFFVSLNMSLFYRPEILKMYIDVFILLFPVTITETVIGAYLGTKMFNRIEKE